MPLSLEQVRKMLVLQDSMNKTVNDDWIQRDHPWFHAIVVEGAEGMDHWGWKWWKKQTTDLPQFYLELVDIWHFVLSHFIQETGGEMIASEGELFREINDEKLSIFFDGTEYTFSTMSTIQKVVLMIGLACAERFSIGLLAFIMDDAHLNWSALYKLYFAKNALNKFRQAHGYKTGEYVKIWDGVEDNVYLFHLVDDIDDASDTVEQDILSALETKYIDVLSAKIV